MPRLQPLPGSIGTRQPDSSEYHFGFQLAVAGDMGVGKSELIVGLTGGTNTLRHGFRGLGPKSSDMIYVMGSAFEIDCESPVKIEASGAFAACFLYCDDVSLKYALSACRTVTDVPNKYLVLNVNDERTSARISLLRTTGKAAAEAAGCIFHEVNLFRMTGISFLQRSIFDSVWAAVPNPPEASLLPGSISLGPLYSNSAAWSSHLCKTILDTTFDNGFRS
eukprot:TRINITY_DN10261_c0_g1_i1.p1 TRINITY_DN10261_c0_g1~~TRINITY_DN10261_c0_g1_i1.p1  ORF type:complete len:221 (+),score=11.84 TRINITY_DN10261_c0_g1_i1:346-1008(+)